MSHMYRRCSKCGATQASSPELRMHRFPALNKNNENVSQLMAWAMFCYPEKDWFDLEALGGLYKSCKVICSRHFADSSYTSTDKIRLQKFALPCFNENEENLHGPVAGPSRDFNLNNLGVHSQIMPDQPKMPEIAVPCIVENEEKLQEPVAGPSHDFNPYILVKTISTQTEKVSAIETKNYKKCKYLLKKVTKLKTALKQKPGKRFCVLENRKFTSELAQKRLAKKIKILQNS